jgi:23S rRNA (uracil1939-C5)-methyltransferase
LIVVDPPPSGLAPGVTDEIAKRSPDLLIYISSDIATFARDSRRLGQKGFILNEVQPIDMYPQNYRALLVSTWQPTVQS